MESPFVLLPKMFAHSGLRKQQGWSFLELIVVMLILAVISSAAISWLGGRGGVSATTQRDKTVVALRQQQLKSLSQTASSPKFEWLSDRIVMRSIQNSSSISTLFSLTSDVQYVLPITVFQWQWDGFGRLRSLDNQILCPKGCTIELIGEQDKAALCVFGEGEIVARACDAA